jgi:hypothetical protein
MMLMMIIINRWKQEKKELANNKSEVMEDKLREKKQRKTRG